MIVTLFFKDGSHQLFEEVENVNIQDSLPTVGVGTAPANQSAVEAKTEIVKTQFENWVENIRLKISESLAQHISFDAMDSCVSDVMIALLAQVNKYFSGVDTPISNLELDVCKNFNEDDFSTEFIYRIIQKNQTSDINDIVARHTRKIG